MYSEKVMDHFLKPRNVGEIPDADGVGTVGNPVCGDMMSIYIKVEDERIADIKFKTFGCGAAIATSSMITEMAKGMTLEEALEVSREDVAEELGVEMVDFNQLLEESDYISINASLTQETYRMFGLAEFQRMKTSAFVINTARGDIIDQEALCTAIEKGYVAGAGLDAVVPEPLPSDHPLLHMDNVIVTAHSAFYSETAFVELSRRATQEVIRVLNGEWPQAFVNPEVKEIYIRKWQKAIDLLT